MASDLGDVKRQVAVANRVLAEVGLATGVTASLGHASLRVPGEPDTFVVKGRGYGTDVLSAMRPEDMILCDKEGFMLDGPPGSSQCYEVKIHSCILKSRPDLNSVVHAHPRFTILMSVLQKNIVPMCQEGIGLVRHPLPLYPRTKIITSEAEGMEVADLLANGNAELMLGHGAVTAGATLAEAVQNMWLLEEQAKMNYYAYCAAGPEHPRIPDELVAEIVDMMENVRDLPHFRDLPSDWRPRSNAVYDHYAEIVSKDM